MLCEYVNPACGCQIEINYVVVIYTPVPLLVRGCVVRTCQAVGAVTVEHRIRVTRRRVRRSTTRLRHDATV